MGARRQLQRRQARGGLSKPAFTMRISTIDDNGEDFA
jgi:hypothetical protein